jgi:uncharacterized protein YndB with AHSA1/START domain
MTGRPENIAPPSAAAAQTDQTELLIRRVFNAPRERVFKAWTDANDMLQWMGPRDFPAVHVELDVRPGGAWRACLRPTGGGPDLWQGGRYLEVVPPERLVYTFTWDEEHPAHGVEMLMTIVFHDRGGKTEMVLRQTKLPSVAERDGHIGGWTSALDRLDTLLHTPTA